MTETRLLSLTICTHHCPDQGQRPHADGLLAHLHLAEEELHQLLGVGAGCRGEGPLSSRPLSQSTGRGSPPPDPPVADAQSLTEGYEAVYHLGQVLAAVLLLGRGLGAHLGRG